MSIRTCSLVAIDGPQGAGKTTLVHAAASRLRERSVQVGVVEEATRDSLYFEEAAQWGGPKTSLWSSIS